MSTSMYVCICAPVCLYSIIIILTSASPCFNGQTKFLGGDFPMTDGLPIIKL